MLWPDPLMVSEFDVGRADFDNKWPVTRCRKSEDAPKVVTEQVLLIYALCTNALNCHKRLCRRRELSLEKKKRDKIWDLYPICLIFQKSTLWFMPLSKELGTTKNFIITNRSLSLGWHRSGINREREGGQSDMWTHFLQFSPIFFTSFFSKRSKRTLDIQSRQMRANQETLLLSTSVCVCIEEGDLPKLSIQFQLVNLPWSECFTPFLGWKKTNQRNKNRSSTCSILGTNWQVLQQDSTLASWSCLSIKNASFPALKPNWPSDMDDMHLHSSTAGVVIVSDKKRRAVVVNGELTSKTRLRRVSTVKEVLYRVTTVKLLYEHNVWVDSSNSNFFLLRSCLILKNRWQAFALHFVNLTNAGIELIFNFLSSDASSTSDQYVTVGVCVCLGPARLMGFESQLIHHTPFDNT